MEVGADLATFRLLDVLLQLDEISISSDVRVHILPYSWALLVSQRKLFQVLFLQNLSGVQRSILCSRDGCVKE
jgi:hypothetical protein